ncbi:unnamed protein product [Darwinula stevensoni]|uniref:RRM domain-containing protein n=1 Tax=Darwinula stevensoni TaxID=69355 RepID=A0A7R8X6A3_9CRUS|nr:unnamed protein product [Darwinula stevensoni]CAG0887931.1 unnamed protein product [Darwinula stevensoni]
MANSRDEDLACKVYIGNLDRGTSKYDLEDVFRRFGPMKNVWVARSPPGFAFVQFEDPRDAEDAVRALDGTRLRGSRIRVEMCHGRRRDSQNSGRRGRDNFRGPPRRRSRSPRSRSPSPRGSPTYGRKSPVYGNRSRSPSPPPRSRSRS